MERWQNRVVVIVGVSADIVMSLAKDLVDAGLIVAGLTQDKKEMDEFRAKLPAHLQARLHGIACDVSDRNSMNKAFDGIEQHLGGVDALINIAGTHSLGQTKEVLQASVKRVGHCTQRAFRSMNARKFSGDIMIVDNLCGRRSQNTPDFSTNIICKLMGVAMCVLHMQMEYNNLPGGVRITNILPNPLWAAGSNDTVLKLEPKDISSCALHVLSLPRNLEEQPQPVQFVRGNAICQTWIYPVGQF